MKCPMDNTKMILRKFFDDILEIQYEGYICEVCGFEGATPAQAAKLQALVFPDLTFNKKDSDSN